MALEMNKKYKKNIQNTILFFTRIMIKHLKDLINHLVFEILVPLKKIRKHCSNLTVFFSLASDTHSFI